LAPDALVFTHKHAVIMSDMYTFGQDWSSARHLSESVELLYAVRLADFTSLKDVWWSQWESNGCFIPFLYSQAWLFADFEAGIFYGNRFTGARLHLYECVRAMRSYLDDKVLIFREYFLWELTAEDLFISLIALNKVRD
jgi:hypothetical protein